VFNFQSLTRNLCGQNGRETNITIEILQGKSTGLNWLNFVMKMSAELAIYELVLTGCTNLIAWCIKVSPFKRRALSVAANADMWLDLSQ